MLYDQSAHWKVYHYIDKMLRSEIITYISRFENDILKYRSRRQWDLMGQQCTKTEKNSHREEPPRRKAIAQACMFVSGMRIDAFDSIRHSRCWDGILFRNKKLSMMMKTEEKPIQHVRWMTIIPMTTVTIEEAFWQNGGGLFHSTSQYLS